MTPPIAMKSADVRHALFFIGNLLRSKVTPADTLAEMAKIQPKHARFWMQASNAAQQGFPLSSCLQPILSEAILTALQAAEASGTLDAVLKMLDETYENQDKVSKALRSLIPPAAYTVFGIGIFFYFSVVVIPPMLKSLPVKSKDPLLQFTALLNEWYVHYGNYLLMALTATIVTAALWLRDPTNRQTVLGAAAKIPHLGPSLTQMHFGVWAFYMATCTRAGITVADAMPLTYRILPHYLQPAVHAVAAEVVQHGLIGASDPAHRPADDPRHQFPLLILTAFRLAFLTGDAYDAFISAGQGLVKQAVQQITLFAKTAEHIIVPIAAIAIGSSVLPYFTVITGSVSTLH